MFVAQAVQQFVLKLQAISVNSPDYLSIALDQFQGWF